MRAQADFADGQVLFSEVDRRPPDLRRCQGAMFMDRPDLWPTNGRRRRRSIPSEQQPLLASEDKPG